LKWLKRDSVSQNKSGITVTASPFNSVKFDLGLFIIVGVVFWLIHDRLIEGNGWQLLSLCAYGLSAMVWLVVKTNTIRIRAECEKIKNG